MYSFPSSISPEAGVQVTLFASVARVQDEKVFEVASFPLYKAGAASAEVKTILNDVLSSLSFTTS